MAKRAKSGVKHSGGAPQSTGGNSKKNAGETPGQFARGSKGRKGQFTGAGDSALTKK